MNKHEINFRKLNHKRIDAFRKLKLFISKTLWTPFSRFKTDETNDHILILRMDDKLGDGISSTGFLREVKSKAPQGQLIVVAGPSTAQLYSDFSFVDQVYVSKKGFFNTLILFFKLNKYNYRFIVNTSHILNPRVIFITSFLKSFKKISFANEDYLLFSDHVKIDFIREHVTERYRKVLDIMNVKNPQLDYVLNVPHETLKTAQNYIDKIKKNASRVIILNSFAGSRLRNFSEQTTKNIVNQLIKTPGWIVLSIANQGDHKILAEWFKKSENNNLWFHNPNFYTLQQNAALLKCADLVITPDTAWVHIASALKAKLVAVYREETNAREINCAIWAPFNTEFKIIVAPSTQENPDDINNLNVVEIEKAVSSILVEK